jgi:hypothetical protein
MKKIFYALAALLLAISSNVIAAPGDTTWVQANNRRFDRGNGYGSYDTAVVFPSGSTSYRKIYMIFTLGKYACPGYNPSNPGEGTGQTGWCGDWDYDVHNIVMTPTDTFELGRLITPYANSNWPRTPLTFKHRYIYDVTDYYPVLRNAAFMRVFYSGYSAGFTGDIKFAFIEGTPERNVLGVSRIWSGGFDYGRGTNINDRLGTMSKTAPAGTASADLKVIITGHGGNGEPNACAEFCPNTYNLTLNGASLATQNFWRGDCGANNLYPQSGTWTHNRANWCPGDLVPEFRYKLNTVNSTNPAYTLGMNFPTYTSNEASYKIDAAVVYYGDYNKVVDAAIEDIIAPSNAEYHYRRNPIAGKPVIMLRNSGSAALTSVRFEYGVAGRTPQTYTWNGTLAPSATTEVTLAELADLKLAPGTYEFQVKVLDANGAADAYTLNNAMASTFVAAPMWPTEIIVQFRNNAQANQTKWKVEDVDGNIIRERASCGTNSLCVDTVSLVAGKAYRLVVSDTNFNAGYYNIPTGGLIGSPTGDGLRNNTGAGYVRVSGRANGLTLPMPAALTGGFEGMFGFGFTHYFYTGWPNEVTNVNAASNIAMQAYPNPATSQLSVYISGTTNAAGTVDLIDLTGRTILTRSYNSGILSVDVNAVAGGVYQLVYRNAANPDIRSIQRIVITK